MRSVCPNVLRLLPVYASSCLRIVLPGSRCRYCYLDGALFVRVSVAMDAIMQDCIAQRKVRREAKPAATCGLR